MINYQLSMVKKDSALEPVLKRKNVTHKTQGI